MPVWQAYHGGGMGAGHLPFDGGYARQPALLMACLEAMDRFAAQVRERFKTR